MHTRPVDRSPHRSTGKHAGHEQTNHLLNQANSQHGQEQAKHLLNDDIILVETELAGHSFSTSTSTSGLSTSRHVNNYRKANHRSTHNINNKHKHEKEISMRLNSTEEGTRLKKETKKKELDQRKKPT